MSQVERERVTEYRLGNYRRRMRETHATPLLCLGLGLPNGPSAGEFVLCLLEDQDLTDLLAMLRALTAAVERQLSTKE
jgi:hypothetical protein